MKFLETDLKRAVMRYLKLRYPNVIFWVSNAGMRFYEHKGKRRAIKIGPTGSPDISGVLPPNGRYIGIECKMKGRTQSVAQVEWQTAIELAGGVYILAYEIEDVMRGLTIYKELEE